MAIADTNTPFFHIVLFIVFMRLGMSVNLPFVTRTALSSLPADKLEVGAGALNFFRQLGAYFQRTASQLNAAVLAAQEQEKEAALPMMLRRLHWAQDELSQRQRCAFPRIDDYDLAQLSVAPSAADEPPIDASSPGGDAVMAEAS